jgi:hypothetical protein
MFAAVTVIAVISGAARLPALLGFLFAIDGLVVAMGLYFVRRGFVAYWAIESGPHDRRCAAVQLRFRSNAGRFRCADVRSGGNCAWLKLPRHPCGYRDLEGTPRLPHQGV